MTSPTLSCCEAGPLGIKLSTKKSFFAVRERTAPIPDGEINHRSFWGCIPALALPEVGSEREKKITPVAYILFFGGCVWRESREIDDECLKKMG